MSAVASFALTALIVELTPGPNMAWLALVSASEVRPRARGADRRLSPGLSGPALGRRRLSALSCLGWLARGGGS
jgi:hypothetical protein